MISAISDAGIRCAAIVIRTIPDATIAPRSASHTQSEADADAIAANGPRQTTTSTWLRNAAGASEMSERLRERTITIAKATVITNGVTAPTAPPSIPPPTISTTPTPARPIAIHVRRAIPSERKSHASSAASIGAVACQKSTFATVV